MKRLLIATIVCLLAFCLWTILSGGSNVYVGQKLVGRHKLESVDHSSWDQLLKKYVDENGKVDYSSWHSNSGDRQKLDQYLNVLSEAKPDGSSKSGQLAFWINAYNAVTIRSILDVYPTTSIRNHTATQVGFNIWKNVFLYVDRQPYSLDQIEHQILRKQQEPRIHFAIVCASIGCPRLRNSAYLPTTVDEQLEDNAVDFFSRPQNFQYDSANRKVRLSALLSWFQEDFGSDEHAMLKTIQPWVPDSIAEQAFASEQVTVEFIEYDWNLNDQKTLQKK